MVRAECPDGQYLPITFAPGFLGDPDKLNLAVQLSRITFPYLLFISLASLMSGVLNSLGKFAAAAATPILLNSYFFPLDALRAYE